MKICSFCGRQNENETASCKKCGAKFEVTGVKTKCNSCGANFEEKESNCPFCGNPNFLQKSFEEKVEKSTNRVAQLNQVDLKPELSSDKVEVEWKWSDYVFTAALNSCYYILECPKCGNEIDWKPEVEIYTCRNCYTSINSIQTKKVPRPLFPIVPELKLKNKTNQKIKVTVTAEIEPDLFYKWTKTMDGVKPNGTIQINKQVDPKPKPEKITLNMPKRANLTLEVFFNDEIVWSDTKEIKILPPNQILWNTTEKILRCFVNPNDSTITEIIVNAKKYLNSLYKGESSFAGYQVSNPSLVNLQVESIYQTLKESFNISYTNCPPTFFQTSSSQTILLPREILAAKSGNCLDLSVLFSSCIERIGLDPVIFGLQGHALPGFFTKENAYREGFWKEGLSESFSEIKYLLDSNLIIPFDATRIETKDFENSIMVARDTLNRDEFQFMINLSLLRESREYNFTPLAFNEK